MRVVFTGGSGKAGRHVVPYLVEQGHEVLNLDLVPLDAPGVWNRRADVTDPGQVWDALTNVFHQGELDAGDGQPRRPDAVVHFAAIPRNYVESDAETFRVNATSTHNVLEAAVKLGIRKMVIASSETTYGICFANGHRKPPSIPLDEETDTDPMDSYAISKVCNERTARGFATRSGADVYALRIGNVIEPHEYETLFPKWFADPASRYRNAFNYCDARDLGQIVHRCLVTDGLGFQVFNAANTTNGMNLPNSDLIPRFFEGVPQTRELGEHEAIYSNRKAREMLGFKEEHDWRTYVLG